MREYVFALLLVRRASLESYEFSRSGDTKGVSPHVVAAMLGHASVATTLGVYAHVTHVSLDALTEAINSRHHARVDLRVFSGETAPGDEGTNEGGELKPRFPSTETECRERESNPYALTSTAP